MMRQNYSALSMAILSSVITAVLISSVFAIADGNPATNDVPKLIPYRGTLEKDGVPFHGSIDMTFKLYDGADATEPVWQESQSVNVFNGKFSVLLGITAGEDGDDNLWNVITNADKLYMEVSVNTGSGDVTLGNRQRFLPVPYAAWTTASTDFHIGNNLYVANATQTKTLGVDEDASIGGNVSVSGSMSVDGNMQIGSDATESMFTIYGQENDGSSVAAIRIEAGGRTMLIDGNEIDVVPVNGAPSRLYLNRGNENAVETGGDLRVGRDLDVVGDIRFDGLIFMGLNVKKCDYDGNGSSAKTCMCDSTNERVVGGGALCTDGKKLHMSRPAIDGSNRYRGWSAVCENPNSNDNVEPDAIWVICARAR